MLTVSARIQIPLRELDFSFVRSSGPGGQNVNKCNTKAVLRWSVTTTRHLPSDVRQRFIRKYRRRIGNDGDLRVTSQRFRDRGRNVADCLNKLSEMIRTVAEAPAIRKPTKPTKGSKLRRRRTKEAISRKKQLRKAPSLHD